MLFLPIAVKMSNVWLYWVLCFLNDDEALSIHEYRTVFPAPCCIDFDIIRQNFYTASNLKDIFHNIYPKRIISFVHAIGLTNEL